MTFDISYNQDTHEAVKQATKEERRQQWLDACKVIALQCVQEILEGLEDSHTEAPAQWDITSMALELLGESTIDDDLGGAIVEVCKQIFSGQHLPPSADPLLQ